MHQWGNPSNEPLTFLAFNINPEVWQPCYRAHQRRVNS